MFGFNCRFVLILAAFSLVSMGAGAAELAKSAIGFGRSSRDGEDEEAINRAFSPEFRNRLDAVIGFDYLSHEVVAKVVEKFILELECFHTLL